MDGDNLETLSRKDTPWTPITGSDMILKWSVFPQEKPVGTFPSSEYAEKAKPSNLGRCRCWYSKKEFIVKVKETLLVPMLTAHLSVKRSVKPATRAHV